MAGPVGSMRTKEEYIRFYKANSPMFETIRVHGRQIDADQWKNAWEKKSKDLGISLSVITHECGHQYQYSLHGRKELMLQNYYRTNPLTWVKPVFTKANCSVCYKIHHTLPELRPFITKYIQKFYKKAVYSDKLSEHTLAQYERFYRFLYRDAYRYEIWKLSDV